MGNLGDAISCASPPSRTARLGPFWSLPWKQSVPNELACVDVRADRISLRRRRRQAALRFSYRSEIVRMGRSLWTLAGLACAALTR